MMPNTGSVLFYLAPMDDVTDVVFRQTIAEAYAPDFFVTEFVNVDGLQSSGRINLMHKLAKRPKETNLIAQIWGKNPDNYAKTAEELVKMGFAGIDINMGCPDKTIVKNGCCAAFIENRDLAINVIKATQQGANSKLPISVKTRLGFNNVDLSWHELLLKQGLDSLTIHGRTKKQMSKVPANWEHINRVRELRDQISPTTKIIGNGDVESRKQGEELAKKYNLDGIMIGRGVFKDPYVFAKSSPWGSLDPQQKIAMYKKHVELFKKTYKNNQRSPATLKRFAKVYVNGFNGASDLRTKIMNANGINGMLSVLKAY